MFSVSSIAPVLYLYIAVLDLIYMSFFFSEMLGNLVSVVLLLFLLLLLLLGLLGGPDQSVLVRRLQGLLADGADLLQGRVRLVRSLVHWGRSDDLSRKSGRNNVAKENFQKIKDQNIPKIESKQPNTQNITMPPKLHFEFPSSK